MAESERYVFALRHVYELDGEDEEKSCGLFESEELAEAARQNLVRQPGFRRFPDGFVIERLKLNQAWWTEGFSTQLPGGEWVDDPDPSATEAKASADNESQRSS